MKIEYYKKSNTPDFSLAEYQAEMEKFHPCSLCQCRDEYEDENGNEGTQYTTDVGYIDILAEDEKGNFVVIELKKGRQSDRAVGQLLRYMVWIKKNLV